MKLMKLAVLLACIMTGSVSAVWADGLIVYGDSWAMTIAEPPGWIGDTQSGAVNGMNIVFYPKGSRWTDSPVTIYGMVLNIKPDNIKHQRSEDRRLNEEHFGKNIRWRDIEIAKPYIAGQLYAGAEMLAASYEKMVWIGNPKNGVVVLFVLNARNGKPQDSVINLFDTLVRSVSLMQKK